MKKNRTLRTSDNLYGYKIVLKLKTRKNEFKWYIAQMPAHMPHTAYRMCFFFSNELFVFEIWYMMFGCIRDLHLRSIKTSIKTNNSPSSCTSNHILFFLLKIGFKSTAWFLMILKFTNLDMENVDYLSILFPSNGSL